MASSGFIGHGTTLTCSLGTVTTTVAQCRSVSVGGVTVNPVNITNMDSDEGFAEYIPGIASPGTLALDLIYAETMATAWAVLFETKTARINQTWTLTFPDDSTYVVTGFLSEFGLEVPYGEALSNTVTIQATGAVAFTEVTT